MGTSDFDVRYAEVQELYNGYQSYEGEVCDACRLIDGSTKELVDLESFQGVAAESVKAYFGEVHLVLVMSLGTLARQLNTDYGKSYYPSFAQGAIAETHADIARWPSDDMKRAEKRLQGLKEGDLKSSTEYLQSAASSFPAGITFSLPSATPIEERLSSQISKTQKVREAIAELENDGRTLFENETGEFENLAKALGVALAACANGAVSLSGYISGGFAATLYSSGLKGAFQSCVTDQEKNNKIVFESRKDSLNKEASRIKRQEEKALEKKKFWCWVGTIASVVVFVAGAVAVVASLGAATPLVAVLGTTLAAASLTKSAGDVLSRAEQLVHVSIDDPLADKNDRKNKAADGATKLGGGIKHAASYEAHYKRGDTKAAYSDISNVGHWVSSIIVDESVDKIVEQVGGETGVYIDGAYQVGKEVFDQVVVDREFNIAGMIGTAGKATEVVADYYAGEADNQLEKLNTRSEKLDKVQLDIAGDSDYSWSAKW